MYAETDHGLSQKGREEAETLRRQIGLCRGDTREVRRRVGTEQARWVSAFFGKGPVFVSPLTRAIETAVIGMRDVIAECEGELIVVKDARERKTVTGADSVGVATGRDIKGRLRKEMRDLYSNENLLLRGAEAEADATDAEKFLIMPAALADRARERKRQAMLRAVERLHLEVSEVQERWWNESAENDNDFQERLLRFMARLWESGEQRVIVVGHSLFFQAAMGFFTRSTAMVVQGLGRPLSPRSASRAQKAALITNQLQKEKMPHCSVVGLQIEWRDVKSPCVLDASFLFDTAPTSPCTTARQADGSPSDSSRSARDCVLS
eukprot:TRINITY_DN18539_c0_g1_i4.p1 TRINITY_DN18539_c0_g1~~TRINITY_DN18539_c0_g1_i4.p1  ORF type:complete len:322 (-),score=57.65 TRINITY_DN18539_c0_g1_i4:485-1450(-)